MEIDTNIYTTMKSLKARIQGMEIEAAWDPNLMEEFRSLLFDKKEHMSEEQLEPFMALRYHEFTDLESGVKAEVDELVHAFHNVLTTVLMEKTAALDAQIGQAIEQLKKF